jgi:ACT domain-containing protein
VTELGGVDALMDVAEAADVVARTAVGDAVDGVGVVDVADVADVDVEVGEPSVHPAPIVASSRSDTQPMRRQVR